MNEMLSNVRSTVRQYLLPKDGPVPEPPIHPDRVSLVAIKIRYLIEELVPVEIKASSPSTSSDETGKPSDPAAFTSYHGESIETCVGSRWR